MTPALAPTSDRLAPAVAPAVQVSVVMPCLNEARTVGPCVVRARVTLQRLGVAGEVIVADNGSSDGSPHAAREAGARIVGVPARGYGNALRGGIAAARGPYVVVGDSDGSYDFGEIGPFLELLDRGHDLVVGNRFRGGIRPGAMPWLHRRVGTPLLTALLRRLFGTPVGDSQCGLRAFRKEAYETWELGSPGMEFASEMLVRATLGGACIAEVPTPLYPDGRGRRPHLRPFRDGWRHLYLLLVLRCRAGVHDPRRKP